MCSLLLSGEVLKQIPLFGWVYVRAINLKLFENGREKLVAGHGDPLDADLLAQLYNEPFGAGAEVEHVRVSVFGEDGGGVLSGVSE